jgi:DNA-binding NarL/FixJ family response regulator
MIRVLLAEDQAMVRGALAALSPARARHRSRRERVADGELAWRQVQALNPDVI